MCKVEIKTLIEVFVYISQWCVVESNVAYCRPLQYFNAKDADYNIICVRAIRRGLHGVICSAHVFYSISACMLCSLNLVNEQKVISLMSSVWTFFVWYNLNFSNCEETDLKFVWLYPKEVEAFFYSVNCNKTIIFISSKR